MKKIILYDNGGLYVIACQFVGMNECGEPELVVMTPAEPVTSLEAFMKENEISSMSLLCEEGQVASSVEVVRMLSPLLKYKDETILTDQINEMVRLGVMWADTTVLSSVIISKSKDEDAEHPYTLQMTLHDNKGVIRFGDYFDSLNEMLDCLSVFSYTLKDQAGIQLTMSLHFARQPNKPRVPQQYRHLFVEITYPYEES